MDARLFNTVSYDPCKCPMFRADIYNLSSIFFFNHDAEAHAHVKGAVHLLISYVLKGLNPLEDLLRQRRVFNGESIFSYPSEVSKPSSSYVCKPVHISVFKDLKDLSHIYLGWLEKLLSNSSFSEDSVIYGVVF